MSININWCVKEEETKNTWRGVNIYENCKPMQDSARPNGRFSCNLINYRFNININQLSTYQLYFKVMGIF